MRHFKQGSRLNARHDSEGYILAGAFHFQQEKRTFPNQHKVSVPSYFRFTSRSYEKLRTIAHNCLPHARQDVLAGTVTEQCLDQPIIPYRGATSDAISDHVGKQIASLEDDIRFSDVSLSVATNVSSSSSSDIVQGSVLLLHYRTLEVRPGRIS